MSRTEDQLITGWNPLDLYKTGTSNVISPAPSTSSFTPTTPNDILAQYGLASQQLTGQALAPIQDILGRMNTGLTPEVQSAMRTQATSTIPQQYESTARQLRSQLLQQGAIGAGELPASSSDILRTFAPLEQARNQAVAEANRNTILANQAEVARNQQRGQEAINQLLTGQSQINQILGTGIQAQNQFAIANLNASTQKWVASLNADTQQQLAKLQAQTSINMNNLDNQTQLKIAEINNAPASLKSILLASLLGTAASSAGGGLLGGVMQKGVDSLIGLVTGSAPATATTISSIVAGAVPEIPLTAIGGGTAATAGGTAAGGAGLGASLTGLLTNPITIGVGAALAGAFIWKKTQVHPTADKFVQTYQNPFGEHLTTIVDQFWQAVNTGQMTRAQAQDARNAVGELIAQFEQDRQNFAAQGSKEAIVARQAKEGMDQYFGVNYSKLLSDLDAGVKGLRA